MENKNVGLLIVGIAIIIAIIVLMFNSVLNDITDATCSHGSSCEMYSSIKTQTGISLAIVGVIVIIGLVIMFTKPKEKLVIKKVKEKKKKLKLDGLEKGERKVVELLRKEGNAMFQADLMEKLEIGKVQTTRLLDKLESKGIIERKRRGMNNMVVLKG